MRIIGGDKRAYYGPVKHRDSESGMDVDTDNVGDMIGFGNEWNDRDDQDLLMSHDDGCNDHM